MTKRLDANDDEIEMAMTRIATLDAWIQLLQQIKDSTEYEAELMK